MNKNKKGQPTLQIFMKKEGANHMRTKFVSSEGKEYVRGLSFDNLGRTVYEKGDKDADGKDINDPEHYIPGKIIPLTPDEARRLEEKKKRDDENAEKMRYKLWGSNCSDFAQDDVEAANNYTKVEDYLSEEQKQMKGWSEKYNSFTEDYIFKDSEGIPYLGEYFAPLNLLYIGAEQAGYAHGMSKERERRAQRLAEDERFKPEDKEQAPVKLFPAAGEASENKDWVKKLPPEDAAQIRKAFDDYGSAEDDILHKDVRDITENEVKSLQKAALNMEDSEKSRAYYDKVKSWYDYAYGTEPQKRDATGRPIEPELKVALLQDPVEPKSKDGVPFSQAFDTIAEQTVKSGAKALQRGMNLNAPSYTLKEDGDIGPKTVSRVKAVLADEGVDSARKRIGAGGFETFIEENRKREVDKQSLNLAVFAADEISGGKLLQSSLNQAGKDRPDFEPLKEDNDVGDKTTSAFNFLKDEEEEKLKNQFRNGLLA